MTQVTDIRRHDVDWLRTLAFLLLILYHVGMYYVADWDYHVKSPRQLEGLKDLMILSNQWRMSLLFFLAGLALALVRGKYSTGPLLRLRSTRLLVPLVFGMLVIVPPQLYVELRQKFGFDGSYVAFMREYLDLGTPLAPEKQYYLGLVTWNHLWFLPYLWSYSVLLLCGDGMWRRFASWLQRIPGVAFLVALVMFLAGLRLALWERFPSTHALLDDWFNHSQYFLVFCSGYLLALLPSHWDALIARRRSFLVLALLGYSWIVLDRHGLLRVGDDLFNEAAWVGMLHHSLFSLNHWAWIFALLAYAGRYLRFSNRFLRYANVAVLPWYILHQTLIIMFAVFLSGWQLPLALEAVLLIALTAAACVLGYELVRRTAATRVLFGVKQVECRPTCRPVRDMDGSDHAE